MVAITNKVLLEHIQAMRGDLQLQIINLKDDLQRQIKDVKIDLQQQITSLDERIRNGFEEARLHRQALQEDLEETMRVQGKHTTSLSRLAQRSAA